MQFCSFYLHIMSETNTQKRFPWLDIVKMFAMICVIAGHVGGLFVNGIPGRLFGLIVAFNMPLFVLLSGYSALKGLLKISSYESLLDYLDKILYRICIPTVCFSAFCQAIQGMLFARKLWFIFAIVCLGYWIYEKHYLHIFNSRVWNLLIRSVAIVFLLISSNWLREFWFLSTLIEIQSLSAVLFWVSYYCFKDNVNKLPVLSVLIWIVPYFLFGSWTFEMAVYFSVGLLCCRFSILERLKDLSFWKSISMFVVGVLLCRYFTIDYGFYKWGLHDLIDTMSLIYVYPLRIIIAVLMSVSIISWIQKLSKEYNWFSRMGAQTMAFYMIHSTIIDFFVKPHLYFEDAHAYMWIVALLCTALLTAVSYAIILLLQGSRLTRCILLGDWK